MAQNTGDTRDFLCKWKWTAPFVVYLSFALLDFAITNLVCNNRESSANQRCAQRLSHPEVALMPH